MRNIKNYAKNIEDVKEMNLSLIIKLMLKMQICSRVDLAKATGLRQSTITNIINNLIERGLVFETGLIAGKKGRRSIGITLNCNAYMAIAVRVTRSGYLVGRFNINGIDDEILVRDTTNLDSASQTLNLMLADVQKLVDSSPASLLGIGIALPGPLMDVDDHIIYMTNAAYDWKSVSIRKTFEARFELPIYIEHDAKAGVLAECWYGSNSMERGHNVYVAAGQGIGAGLAIDGKIVHGAIGIAGEIGHMCINFDGPKCQCGNCGCLEKYCSVLALLEMARDGVMHGRKTCLNENSTAKDIANAYSVGDPFAIEIFQKVMQYLGIGLVNIIYIFNPSIIILGDELLELFPELPDAMLKLITRIVPKEVVDNVEIRASSLKLDPAFIGAAAQVMERAFSRPSQVLYSINIEA